MRRGSTVRTSGRCSAGPWWRAASSRRASSASCAHGTPRTTCWSSRARGSTQRTRSTPSSSSTSWRCASAPTTSRRSTPRSCTATAAATGSRTSRSSSRNGRPPTSRTSASAASTRRCGALPRCCSRSRRTGRGWRRCTSSSASTGRPWSAPGGPTACRCGGRCASGAYAPGSFGSQRRAACPWWWSPRSSATSCRSTRSAATFTRSSSCWTPG
mmetsp:Transcript_1444/g.4315  ORF Transcript_1444/g.4315 Transcript_1444/m.4315 type:complete len:214 (+) Transcript_1444:3422-4063(+)